MRRLRKSGVRSGDERGYFAELEKSQELKRCGYMEILLPMSSEKMGRRCFEQRE